MVDLKTGESFTFLGFEYRRILSLRRKWRPHRRRSRFSFVPGALTTTRKGT
jgi:hypothetical protein